jgi:hypothetical protein
VLVCALDTGALDRLSSLFGGVGEKLNFGHDPSYPKLGRRPAVWQTWRLQSLWNGKPHFRKIAYCLELLASLESEHIFLGNHTIPSALKKACQLRTAGGSGTLDQYVRWRRHSEGAHRGKLTISGDFPMMLGNWRGAENRELGKKGESLTVKNR